MRRFWLRLDRSRPILARLMLIAILIQLGASAFFELYWSRNNLQALDSKQLWVSWLSDEDMRAMAESTGPEYTTRDGLTTYVFTPGSDREERTDPLGDGQIDSPDHKWHATVSARLRDQSLRIWSSQAIPIAIFCVVGLIAGRPGAGKAPAAPEL